MSHDDHRPPVRPARILACSALLAALLLPAGGCETLEALAAGVAKPTASVEGVRLRQLTLDGAALAFDVRVDNPYSVGLPLSSLSYDLGSGGTSFLRGSADVGGAIEAGRSTVVEVPAEVTFADLLAVLRGVRPGSLVPYDANLDLTVDAPGIGPISLPLRTSGDLPVPAPPSVALERVSWEELSLTAARALLTLRIENPNAFGFDLSDLDYSLSLANQDIATAGVSRPTSFGPGETQRLEIPISFAPSRLGLSALEVLRGRSAEYGLSGQMQIKTPFGPLSVPLQASGQTTMTR